MFSLLNCGYHVLKNEVPKDAQDADAAVCAKSVCFKCGHVGMDYVPFYRKEGGSYRAFASCPKCGYEVEL